MWVSNSESMATLFISDLHLTDQRPDATDLFLVFLKEQAVSADVLYILGDFFEYWIGDESVADESVRPIIDGLNTLTSRHTPVYVMHGNRDVLLGAKFEKASGCQLLQDPTVIDLNGEATLISHGDYLCTDDVEHQKFRKMINDPEWQQRFLSRDIEERDAVARTYREISKANLAEKSSDIMDVNQQAVEQALLDHNVTQMIHGHTHRPAIHEFLMGDRQCRRIVLGDWYDQGSVLHCDHSGCELQGLPLASQSRPQSSLQ